MQNQFAGTSYRQSSPLSNDQIMRIAPSVFAEEKHSSRSDRYTYIPTIQVLDGLRKEGFEPFEVSQGRSRIAGKAEFTKHMLRLRHRDNMVVRNVGDEFNEIALINSHDGTSSYQMFSGIFRAVCSNGLVVCHETLNDIRVPHKGDIVNDVIQGAYNTLDGFGIIRDVTENMKALRLSAPEARIFADAALSIKYDDEETSAPFDAGVLLRARRTEDTNPDLWTTFNRIQENLVRGGIPGRTADGRRTRTREVTAIDSNVKLNRALWTLAERMAELKASA
jgi:hypothetical protein